MKYIGQNWQLSRQFLSALAENEDAMFYLFNNNIYEIKEDLVTIAWNPVFDTSYSRGWAA